MRQREGKEVGEEVVEDEDEDDQEETEVGWLGERQGVKKVRAREMKKEGWRDILKEKEEEREREREGEGG